MELSEDIWKGIEEDERYQYNVRLTGETLVEDKELKMATATEIEILPFNPYNVDIYDIQ